MPVMVHLADAKHVAMIRKNGIRVSRMRPGVYCMPVTSEFYYSHQWLRELRRRGVRTIVAVYFRIPDDEPVIAGGYNQAHKKTTASQAVGSFMKAPAEQRLGWEVILPRSVRMTEITRVQALSQITGWRFYPGAKGHRPCWCEFCSRGLINSRRNRVRSGGPDAITATRRERRIWRAQSELWDLADQLNELGVESGRPRTDEQAAAATAFQARVDRCVAQGLTRAEVYTLLNELLTDDDLLFTDVILDLMDTLVGWCHPDFIRRFPGEPRDTEALARYVREGTWNTTMHDIGPPE